MKGSCKNFIIFLIKKRAFFLPCVAFIHFIVVTFNHFPCHLVLAFISSLDRLQRLLHWKLLWKYFGFSSKFAFPVSRVWFILWSVLSWGAYLPWRLVDRWKEHYFQEYLWSVPGRSSEKLNICIQLIQSPASFLWQWVSGKLMIFGLSQA